MSDLTDKQIEMLYEMAEIHFQWFQRYAPESGTTYEDVLELNHIKITSIVEGCFDCSEDMINIIMESILKDYKEMLEDLD